VETISSLSPLYSAHGLGLGLLPRLFPLRSAWLSFLASKNRIWNVLNTRDRQPRRYQVDDLGEGRWIWCRWICRRFRRSDGFILAFGIGRGAIDRDAIRGGLDYGVVVLKPPLFISGEVDRHLKLSGRL